MNEIHELGLMYLNYEILSMGYKTIYLGESVPIESLIDLKNHFDNITFVCYMTVEPNKDEVSNYINDLTTKALDESSNLWLIGRMVQHIEENNISNKISMFHSIKELVDNL